MAANETVRQHQALQCGTIIVPLQNESRYRSSASQPSYSLRISAEIPISAQDVY